MIGETGANVNKVIIVGNHIFNQSIGDELFCKADIKSTMIDKDLVPNMNMVLRHVNRTEVIIVSLEHFTSVTIAIVGIAKALGKLIIGVAHEGYFEKPTSGLDETLLLELCDFNCVHEDIVYEVTKYL